MGLGGRQQTMAYLQADQGRANAKEVEGLVGEQGAGNAVLLDGCLLHNHLLGSPAQVQSSFSVGHLPQYTLPVQDDPYSEKGKISPSKHICTGNGAWKAGLGLSTTPGAGTRSSAKLCQARPSRAHLTSCHARPVEMKEVATPNRVNSTGRGGTPPCRNTHPFLLC